MQAKIKLESNFSIAEESPGFLLWKAANLLQRSHIAALKELKITPAQFSLMSCLVYLAENQNVTSALISKYAGLDKMMVSDLVKTLAKKQFLKTQPNQEDGRSFLIIPTDLGIKITNQAIKKVEAIDEVFFEKIKNKADFMESLLQIVRNTAKLP